MKWLMEQHNRLLWLLGMLMAVPGTGFCEPGPSRLAIRGGYPLVFPEIWLGGGFSYFPFYMQPLPIYPEVTGLYPCFPFGSCMVWQPYRKYEWRNKQKQTSPEPVFRRGEPLVDEAMEAWRAGLYPAAELFRTDAQSIKPAFREHSLIRPEYKNAGSVLPKFSTDSSSKNTEDNEHESSDD